MTIHAVTISIIVVLILIAGFAAYVFLQSRKGRRRNRPRPLSEKLSATHKSLGLRLNNVFARDSIDDEFMAELEKTLLSADVGIKTSERVLDVVSRATSTKDARRLLRKEMTLLLAKSRPDSQVELPRVILVLGVNGVGKTTSIAKLAYRFQGHGQRVLLAACDTFRAAAIEQLQVWGRRLGCDVVAQEIGSDAASVAFDAVSKAKSKGHEIVLIDTAGRLHTKHNLMEELKKIDRVIGKAHAAAPHEKWLVIDASVGQNGLNQAQQFHEALGLTGVIVTKLDGTARGGIVCSIVEMGIPVVSIGVGEGIQDLRPFDAHAFVDAILGIQ